MRRVANERMHVFFCCCVSFFLARLTTTSDKQRSRPWFRAIGVWSLLFQIVRIESHEQNGSLCTSHVQRMLRVCRLHLEWFSMEERGGVGSTDRTRSDCLMKEGRRKGTYPIETKNEPYRVRFLRKKNDSYSGCTDGFQRMHNFVYMYDRKREEIVGSSRTNGWYVSESFLVSWDTRNRTFHASIHP